MQLARYFVPFCVAWELVFRKHVEAGHSAPGAGDGEFLHQVALRRRAHEGHQFFLSAARGVEAVNRRARFTFRHELFIVHDQDVSLRHDAGNGFSTFGTIATSGAIVDRFGVGYRFNAIATGSP